MSATGPRNGVLGTVTAIHPAVESFDIPEVTVCWDDLPFAERGVFLLIAEVVA